MADRIWLDVDGDWTNTSNWSGGSVPSSSDDVYFLEGSKTIQTNLPGSTSGVNYGSITVGRHFEGSIGTSGTSLYVGTVSDVYFSGELCRGCFLTVDSGDAITRLIVDYTYTMPDTLHIVGGTVTNAIVRGGRMTKIGASATCTNLYLNGNGTVVVEEGATLTNAYQAAGVVKCSAEVATLCRIYGGHWYHEGDTTYDIATLDIGGTGTFHFNSEGGTVTTCNLFAGGKLNAYEGVGTPRTITTLNRYGGVVNKWGTGTTLTISTDNDFGGVIQAVSGPSGPTS